MKRSLIILSTLSMILLFLSGCTITSTTVAPVVITSTSTYTVTASPVTVTATPPTTTTIITVTTQAVPVTLTTITTKTTTSTVTSTTTVTWALTTTPPPTIQPTTSTTTPTKVETFNLRFATSLMPSSEEYLMVYKPIIDEIEQRSNDRIIFNIYPGGSLVSRPEQYEAVRTGIADMSITYFAHVSSFFPLCEVFTFPAAYELSNDGEYLIQTLGSRIFTVPDATEVLSFFQQQPYYLYTSSKQVKTLDDMKGLKIVANTQLQQAVLTALGAVPIAMSQAEVYEATVKDIIDGILATPAMIDTYSLTEVYKYVLELPLGYNTGMINMNINTWTSLPDDLKTVVKEAVLKTGYSFVQQFNEDKAKVDGALIASGGTVNTLTDEEQVLWVNVFKPVIDKWVADKSARGLPVTDLLNVIRVECRNLDIPFPY